MNSIVYVGMDVHKESYTLASYDFETDSTKHVQRMPADYKMVLKYLDSIRRKYDRKVEIICGYEAGCLGYSLYNELNSHDVNCIILAPSTITYQDEKKIKTDRRDAASIARAMALGSFREVYVPDERDVEIKEYLRMKNDHRSAMKVVKQQILALILRLGYKYDGKTYWTIKHRKWMKELELNELTREVLDEYLLTLTTLEEKIARMDQRIEKLSSEERYRENVKKLVCFIGIKTHAAIALICETSDFYRFPKAENYASFLGLVPSVEASGNNRYIKSITKAGNHHLRTLLVEAAQCICRGQVGQKSLALKKRQDGNTNEIIAYADRANERLRRKYYHMIHNGTQRNVAVVAVARELACFVWGMMTDHIE